MSVDFINNPEILLANAIEFLIQGQEFKEAGILLLCDIGLSTWENNGVVELYITLTGDRAIYNMLQDEYDSSTQVIQKAFEALVPRDYWVKGLRSSVKLRDSFDPNWRVQMLEMIEGKRPLNQGIPIKEAPRFEWQHLYFRSPVEISIAKALEKYKVLFLPNCMARLGIPDARENKEADFLICYEGKWGILEINGDTYHTNSAKDHNRSRLFKQHGIRVFELYEASRYIKEPTEVVIEFLKFLRQNG